MQPVSHKISLSLKLDMDMLMLCWQVDLTGGYYDAGDNVKFGLPMAFTITTLSWNVVEFSDELQATGQLQNALNNIRWGTDYLLQCYTDPTELWVQVSLYVCYMYRWFPSGLQTNVTARIVM